MHSTHPHLCTTVDTHLHASLQEQDYCNLYTPLPLLWLLWLLFSFIKIGAIIVNTNIVILTVILSAIFIAQWCSFQNLEEKLIKHNAHKHKFCHEPD